MRTVNVLLLSALAALCLIASARRAPAQEPNARPTRWRNVLDKPGYWYGSDEATRIADNVLAHQHPGGGWGKNIDMTRPLSQEERERARERARRTETLIDNGATYTQIRYLARVYNATGERRFREAYERGLDYLFEAQYDNGGWPMIYPLQEGYYSRITFNDGAMMGVMRLLRDVARGEPPFDDADPQRRERAAAAIEKGIDAILRTQVEVDGRLTAWCAQHDEHDFRPRKARSYELPSLSGMESVEIVRYLMSIKDPSPEVIRAVTSAAEWFDEARIEGIEMVWVEAPDMPGGRDRVVVERPDAPSQWARFYEIGTNKPMFVGRDGVVRDHLADIEHERRMGYRYLGPFANELLEEEYPAWRKRVGLPPEESSTIQRDSRQGGQVE